MVEKVGVVVDNLEDIQMLFQFYDTDQSGSLDYQEFSAILFGNQSSHTRKMAPQPTKDLKVERLLEAFR